MLSSYELIQEGIEFLEQIPGYDSSYTVIYYNYWSGYEENHWMAILERNQQYYIIEGGYSVMADGNQDDKWILDPITSDDAINLAIEFDQVCVDEQIIG